MSMSTAKLKNLFTRHTDSAKPFEAVCRTLKGTQELVPHKR